MKNRGNIRLRVRHDWAVLLLIFCLIGITAISAIILSRNPNFERAHAADSNTPIAVTVASVCTITGTTESGDEHSAEMSNGNYLADVGETTISVICNDGEGFSVYAIGYSGNEDGVSSMIGVSSGLTIPTGLVTDASASNWAMKLTAVSGTYTPTMLSDNEGPFTSYHTIPSINTKVATRPNGTSASSSSQFTATFAFGVSAAQAADTYVGKVKFTLVHPNFANPSGALPTISNLNYMQDFSSLSYAEYNNVLASMTLNQQYQLKDNRDGKIYYIAKLADGNVWMTQNLDHDIVTTEDFYTYANTDIGHGSMRDTTAKWTASTATYATDDTTWNDTPDEPESYDPGDLCWNGVFASDYTGTLNAYTVACGEDKKYHIGNYYNWTAAVAMNNSSFYTADTTDVNQSICPAGWRLPVPSGNESYNGLIATLNLTSSTSGNVQNAPVNFVYGGIWVGSSANVGGSGGYWSSMVSDAEHAFEFNFNYQGDITHQYDGLRNFNISVRCVARTKEPGLSDIDYMQDMTPETVALTPVGTTATLVDNRDNKTYTVAKLADGNIWMTQNLDHDIVTTEGFYTYANTDIGHGATPNTSATWTASSATFATNDTTWTNTVDEPESYDPGDICWNGAFGHYHIVDGTVACGEDKHHHIGNYYNWTAAVAMNDSSSYITNLTNVDQSICPAGWMLPTYSDNKSFDNLVSQLNLTSGNSGNIHDAPAYLVYSGFWGGSSFNIGTYGIFWTSLVSDDDYAHNIYFNNNGVVIPRSNDDRNDGNSVRCVARTDNNGAELISNISDLTYMQDFNILSPSEKSAVLNSMTLNQQYELSDNRDNKIYTIAKLADGNVWMTQNLDHDIVTTENFYTYDNTDIGHDSTPYIGTMWTASTATYSTGDTTWVGTESSPESYNPGDYCWSGTPNDGVTAACNQSGNHYHLGNYYNWTAAVAMNDSSGYTDLNQDADQSICPAGWTLPKDGLNVTTSGSIYYLLSQYGWDSSTNEMTGSYELWGSPLYLSLNGRYWYGSKQSIGIDGYLWSSRTESDTMAIEFFLRNDNVAYLNDRAHVAGNSVRCVAR
ncbi:hypothetical protein IKT18_02330 [Candidatus Saccharibacteria bacterium]|nr:hypothetical protein [Candidatus Saccharibacteria bacterium]